MQNEPIDKFGFPDPKTWPYDRLVIPRLRPHLDWRYPPTGPIDRINLYEAVYRKRWLVMKWPDGGETRRLVWDLVKS